MQMRIFTLPFDPTSESFPDEIITEFCLNKKVHQIESQFFQHDGHAYWSVSIQYEIVLRGEDRLRELDDAQKLLLDRLKQWRKERALKEGIPVYLIAATARCSNRNNNTPGNRNNNLGFRLANTALTSRMPAFTDAGSVNELSSRLIRHALAASDTCQPARLVGFG